MKKRLLRSLKEKSLFTLMVLIFVTSFNLSAQDDVKEAPENVYVEVLCFKSKAPGATKMFKEWGKAFHEELIRQGVLVNWSFYYVDFPNGEDCECNYREVRAFTDIKSMDKLSSEEFTMGVAAEVFKDQDLEAMMKQFSETVEFRNSQVYVMKDELVPGPSNSHMIVVNYMDVAPGMGDEYVQMEREVFKPVHAENHKNGNLTDWSLWQKILPYGSDSDHDYLTVDVWGSYENMANNNAEKAWKVVHPDKDPAMVYEKMAKTRDLKKAEVWINVARADIDKGADASSSNE